MKNARRSGGIRFGGRFLFTNNAHSGGGIRWSGPFLFTVLVATGELMAILGESARGQVWRGLMRYWSREGEVLAGMIKQDIRVAVDNTDVWIDSHEGNTGDTTGYNGALPTLFKNNATAGQKSDLFIFVAARRRSVDILKKLFAEVD